MSRYEQAHVLGEDSKTSKACASLAVRGLHRWDHFCLLCPSVPLKGRHLHFDQHLKGSLATAERRWRAELPKYRARPKKRTPGPVPASEGGFPGLTWRIPIICHEHHAAAESSAKADRQRGRRAGWHAVWRPGRPAARQTERRGETDGSTADAL
ncbi:hypothetical protein NDU88_001085 [Pleurodeles waltl]|uniref:Uncharacterized protein n=1 Tax=Pleurodeles waltl TaxID=8319 RepID=A0AAV7MKJ1_PLEWA|nr:hypothetical protein NDU88_001085 [Pleurodeles waltl]